MSTSSKSEAKPSLLSNGIRYYTETPEETLQLERCLLIAGDLLFGINYLKFHEPERIQGLVISKTTIVGKSFAVLVNKNEELVKEDDGSMVKIGHIIYGDISTNFQEGTNTDKNWVLEEDAVKIVYSQNGSIKKIFVSSIKNSQPFTNNQSLLRDPKIN